MNHIQSRREFLAFMGRTALISQVGTISWAGASSPPFTPLKPSDKDALLLAEGFESQILIKQGDRINAAGETFGMNCDFVAYFPTNKSGSEGILGVNHEYPAPLFIASGYQKGQERTEAQVLKEQESVGVSLLQVKRDAKGKWAVVPNSPLNRRVSGRTEIPFAWDTPIAGAKSGVGTLGNCAGGKTPWGTYLTCEENYDVYYGEVDRGGKIDEKAAEYGWNQFHARRPEHYGWVVEIDPKTGASKKLIALGRCAHEGATVVLSKDGRPVVYMGDDAEDRCLYKFVADKPGSLERGQLFVADTLNGKWILLDREKNPTLKKEFKDQTELLIHTRLAAQMVGGTPLHRPEDIAVDPLTGAVFISLTNSAKHGDAFGSIARLEESGHDPLAGEFAYSVFAAGSATTFGAPDNLEFDRKGNLWMTTDMSGKLMNTTGPYSALKNNGLFYLPTVGPQAGKSFLAVSAPRDAELTGPCFTPDFETLFLCVQHPGELSKGPDALTSHWPDGKGSTPRSSLVALSGKAFRNLI